jgi:hypothetical protein
LLAAILNGEGEIFMARVNFRFWDALRAEARFDSGGRRGIVSDQEAGRDAIGIVVRNYEFPQINSGLAIRGEAHHSPFVAVGLEAEILRELRVEKAERIRPRDRPEVFERSVPAAPERGSLPRAAPVENENGGILES